MGAVPLAKRVEDSKAPRILTDVSKFRHRPSEEVGEWRRENISTRYNAAGEQRFAFLPFEGFAGFINGEPVITRRTVPDPIVQ